MKGVGGGCVGAMAVMAHEEVSASNTRPKLALHCCCAGLEPYLCPCVAAEGTHAGESYPHATLHVGCPCCAGPIINHAKHSWCSKHAVHMSSCCA